MSKTMKRASALLLAVIMIAVFMPMMQEDAFAAAKKPGKVAKLKVKAKKQKVTVTWGKIKNAKKVQVIVKLGKKTVAKKTVKASKKKAVFDKLGGKTYKVYARALNGKKKGPQAKKSVKVALATLSHKDWNPEVKKALNDMMKAEAQNNQYVVFDFDNTCSIFDVEEQLAVYQLQVMAFAEDVDAKKLADMLATELDQKYFTEPAPASEDYCANKDATYQDWIDDICAAYQKLLDKGYKPSPKGVDFEKYKDDPDWQEFATKMRAMYDCVFDSESAAVAYPWVLYWFTGMTEQEVYDLAKASHTYYKAQESKYVTWETKGEGSKIGACEYEFTWGTAVSENIQELWKALDANGIDVWVCSASATDPIRAAIDVWGGHDAITGMMAMTNKLEGGKYINAYDWDGGYAWFPVAGGKWKKDTVKQKTQTQGEGKVIAIQNVLYPKYKKHGPIAGFMDSTGDYNFCTEFKTLQVVCCFNRASRKVTDGGGVIAELAVYQADTLKMDYASRGEDTLYVLQGREENGLRGFRPERETLRLGKEKTALFRNEDNDAQLAKMIELKMDTKTIVNDFAIKTPADDPKYGFSFKYGFVTGVKGEGLGAKFPNGWDFQYYHTQA